MVGDEGAQLSIRLMGEVRVELDGDAVGLGGRQPRLVLATLGLAVPRPVGLDHLVSCLWGDQPPPSATKTVQALVSRLRAVLGAEHVRSERLGGYSLAIPPEAVDAHRLSAALDRANAAPPSGDVADRLEAALADASGEPFGAWALADPLERQRRRLARLQAAAGDRLAELRCALGDHLATVALLEELVTGDPLSERRWELLMIAHAAVGNRVEALRCYQRARAALVGEVGVEPGPGLRQLEAALLAGGPLTEDRPDLPAKGSPIAEAGSCAVVGLPHLSTSFVGREAELAELALLLGSQPLTTLVGPGGMGKTRLAVEAARGAAAGFPGGVYFCDLAAVDDPSAVAQVAAAVTGVRLIGRRGVVGSIIDALATDRVLLVVDNCEHVLDAVADLVGHVLDGCPRTAILATSRERLGLAAERIVPIGMLHPEQAASELFESRARLSDPTFHLDGQRATVAAICRQLDGMPLGIELAATWMRTLGPAQLLDRLDDRFSLLQGHRRGDRFGRHPTLLRTVEWSYELLRDAERRLFDQLSAFRGSFDLDAVAAVCGHGGDLEALELVDRLVERSMVQAEPGAGGRRFRLLETLRQYGEARLAERDQLDATARRHLLHYSGLAERARRQYESHECLAGVAAFRAEWDNLRAAHRWAIEHGEPDRAADLVESVTWYGYLGLVFEVSEWAELAVAAGADRPSMWGVMSMFAHQAGDHGRSVELAETGLGKAPHRLHPDTHWCHWGLGVAHTHAGRVEVVAPNLDDQETTALASGSAFSHAMYVAGRAVWAATACPEESPRYGERGLALTSRLGSRAAQASAYLYAAAAQAAAGNAATAADYYDRALAHATASGNRSAESLTLAWRAVRTPRHRRDAAYAEAVERLAVTRDWLGMGVCLDSLAAHWAGTDPALAALVIGFLQAHGIGHVALVDRRQRALAALAPGSRAHLLEGARLDRATLIDKVLERLRAPAYNESAIPTAHSRR